MPVLDNPAHSLVTGRTTVTTAGTRVQINASATSIRNVTITALSGNTGNITVGDASVVAAAGTRQGIPLSAGDTVSLDIDNLATIYLDSTVNGEGVSWAYLTT